MPRTKSGGYGIQWLTFGAAYRYATFQFSTDVAISTEGETPEVYIGTEWHPFRFLPIRFGVSNGALTVGMGLAWRGIRINHARIF